MSSWEGKTRGGVLGYKIFIWILKKTGISFAYFFLRFVVLYFVFTSGKAFSSIFYYFRKIQKYNIIKSFISVFQNYYIFGQVLLDKIALLAGLETGLTFNFEGEEHLQQMQKGGVLVSAHVGNWEIAGQLLNRLEKKINIILFDAEHQQVKKYLTDVMSQRNVHFIIIRDDYSHLLEIREALANHEIIAMHGDRFIEGNKTVQLNFMGEPALFPLGPVHLASRFRVPVSFVFAVKERRKHYHFFATPLLHIPGHANLHQRDAALTEAVKVYVGKLEEILKKYPLQWFNYYPFWSVPSDLSPITETAN